MSHFLERLTYLSRRRELFASGPRRAARRRSHVGGGLPAAVAVRQDRALNPRRELYRLVQLKNLRQERRCHLGNAADRLSANAAGYAQSRAARMFARRLLQLVSLQR
jgi:hypothetical protein